jgi:AbiV family abortive infection protein
LNRTDLFKGAILALNHSASVLEAAASLYADGRVVTCFLLATLAREELGRFALLQAKAHSLSHDAKVEPAALKGMLDKHLAKLRAGQTTYPVPMPLDWMDEWKRAIEHGDSKALEQLRPEWERAKRVIRRREPNDTHRRRLQTQYVDPQEDGSWSGPDSISDEDVRVALMGTAAGIANTLIGLQSDPDLRVVAVESGLMLPNMGDFMTRVLGKIANRGV